jgi:hypothetical protein
MLGRLLAVVASLGAAAGCYSPPEPDCGFACGPGGACPADYTCAADHHCHRDGTPASLNCGPPPVDAGPDSPHVAMLSLTPADGATNVAVDTLLQAFSDQVLQGNPGLTLVSSLGVSVAVTGRYVSSGMGLEFTPATQLLPNEHYTATISPDVVGQQGALLSQYEWSFDTGADTVVPHMQSSDPAANDTGVAVTTGIRVTFDEPVTGVDATSFTATDGVTPVVGTVSVITPRIYELRPASSLTAASTITVSLGGAIMDTSGNALAPVSYSFTTQ